MINGFSLKKIWLYLCLLFFVTMWLLVLSGNPKLPILSLAENGWDWHHIPEILSSFCFGAWVGSFGFLSYKGFSITDVVPILFLFLLWVLVPSTYSEAYWLIVIIVAIPSFCGYLCLRLYEILTRAKEMKVLTT